jgi:hypothetical protein
MRPILHCTTEVSHVSKEISCQLFLKSICFFKNLLPIVGVPENYRENIFGSVTKKIKEEMCGENLTADLEQLTSDVHLLAKVFWLCTYHAHMGFAAVQSNDHEPFIYFNRTVTINYYLLGGNI